jgi:RepB DNA-primase N-terminal domain
VYQDNPSAAPGEFSNEALSLWRHIYGDDARGRLHIFTATRGADGELEKRSVRVCNFNYPAAAPSAAKWARLRSSEGAECYFCVHLLYGPERNKYNAVAVAALWADLDGAPVPNAELAPSAVLESSPGRYHCFWRLRDALPPEDAEALNRRLTHAIGADPGGFALTKILRVPGSRNFKYEDAPVVRLLELDEGRSYVPGELDELLPGSAGDIGQKAKPKPAQQRSVHPPL